MINEKGQFCNKSGVNESKTTTLSDACSDGLTKKLSELLAKSTAQALIITSGPWSWLALSKSFVNQFEEVDGVKVGTEYLREFWGDSAKSQHIEQANGNDIRITYNSTPSGKPSLECDYKIMKINIDVIPLAKLRSQIEQARKYERKLILSAEEV